MRRGAIFDIFDIRGDTIGDVAGDPPGHAPGRYRYRLWRTWDAALPRVAFVMLNPSTADHRKDDPTIRRCIGLSRAWGYGGLVVVNLFAYRTPAVAALRQVPDPIGPDNDRHVRAASRRAAAVVLAWGVHGTLHGRDQEVLRLLGRCRRPLLCLGTTRDGHPRHPLYLPSGIRPARFVC
jgi:hypothetical protein